MSDTKRTDEAILHYRQRDWGSFGGSRTYPPVVHASFARKLEEELNRSNMPLPTEATNPPRNDPKGAAGKLKTPLQLLPTEPMRAAAVVLGIGAEKYGIWNWRTSGGVEAMTYIGALRRHIDKYVDKEEFDEESGESHLASVIAGAMILLDALHTGQLIDNRPPTPIPHEQDKTES